MRSAYLFTWNPAKWDWDKIRPGDIARQVTKSRAGSKVLFDWSCARSKKPQRGDRAFLIKLGNKGRGIFASGKITKGSYESPKSAHGRCVDIEFDVFLDPHDPRSRLAPNVITGQHWTPQSSGAAIKPAAHAELEVLWAEHLRAAGHRTNPYKVSKNQALEAHEFEALEGEVRQYVVLHRQREHALRDRKLEEARRVHGKVACEVCAFDFQATYGVSYAEVHHLKPLSNRDKPSHTKLHDLAVLCANCHRVAHSDPKKVLSVSALKNLLREPAGSKAHERTRKNRSANIRNGVVARRAAEPRRA